MTCSQISVQLFLLLIQVFEEYRRKKISVAGHKNCHYRIGILYFILNKNFKAVLNCICVLLNTGFFSAIRTKPRDASLHCHVSNPGE